MRIDQFLPNLSYGDAISNHAIEIRKVLKKLGYKSDIYVQYIDPKLKKEAKLYKTYKPDEKNIIIFHASIGSDIEEYVYSLKEKVILIYHNITPHHFFKGYNETLVQLAKEGRENLRRWIPRAILAVGDSEYNENELKTLGFFNTATLPIIVDYKKYDRSLNRKLYDKYDDGWTNLLYVSRICPHKKQDDLIRMFYFYKKYVNPKSRLFVVGNDSGFEKYGDELKALVKRFKIDDVFITGRVEFRDLATYFKLASVFVSMSEHEGFSVPLLECMHLGIPVVAYRSSAIPYTLKDSGVMFDKKNYSKVAELIDIVVKDKNFRESVTKKQKERLKVFERRKVEKILKSLIDISVRQKKNNGVKTELLPAYSRMQKRFKKYQFFLRLLWRFFDRKPLEGSVKRILFIKLDHLGDLLMATPIFRAAKNKYPKAKITVMVNPSSKAILENNPYVDEIIPYDTRYMRKNGHRMSLFDKISLFMGLRAEHYDIAVNFRNDYTNSVILFLTGAHRRVSHTNVSHFPYLVNDAKEYDPALHELDRNAELVSDVFEVPDRYKLDIFPSKSEKKKVKEMVAGKMIAIHPGSGFKGNSWQYYGELIEKMHKSYPSFHIVLTGGPQEVEECNVLEKKYPYVLNYCNKFNVREMAEFYKHVRLLICNDGGGMHLAEAVDARMIAIFGPSPCAHFRPMNPKAEVIYSNFPCSPCPQFEYGRLNVCESKDCLKSIKADTVFEILRKRL